MKVSVFFGFLLGVLLLFCLPGMVFVGLWLYSCGPEWLDPPGSNGMHITMSCALSGVLFFLLGITTLGNVFDLWKEDRKEK